MLHSQFYWRPYLFITVGLLVALAGCDRALPVSSGPRQDAAHAIQLERAEKTIETVQADSDQTDQAMRPQVEDQNSLDHLARELTEDRHEADRRVFLAIIRKLSAGIEGSETKLQSLESEYVDDLGVWIDQLPEHVKSELPLDASLSGPGWCFKFNLTSPRNPNDADAIPPSIRKIRMNLQSTDGAQIRKLLHPVITQNTTEGDKVMVVLECVIKDDAPEKPN